MKKIIPEYEFSAEQLNTVKQLAFECGLLEDTVKILYGRGIDDKEKIISFIRPSREQFISPFKMSGMAEAVELITRARDEGWTVAVYGDYDADGICASTIMYRALCDFGIEPIIFVPERRDGYGLNKTSIDTIFDEYFPQLFITVDCGISCAEEVEYIKEQGAEVIVTDHHELPDTIPDCICINPKFNDGYIYDNLCGAGVALKVAVALNGESAYSYLDFATIATVADSVPLTGENRNIVSEGLKLINDKPRPCYSGFFTKNDSAVTAQTVAFNLAPKINAAGRMGDANSAVRLFTETDENEIFNLSAKLTAYNIERQKYCDELYLSAKQKIKEKGAYGKVIMLWDENWNTGFVGIVAARLAEEYARPALLFVRNGNMLKGSVRSVENINVFEALKACEGCIAEFGGHAQAAGVNIEIENFEKLEEELNEYLSANYSPADFEHTVYISGKLERGYSERFAHELEMLEPFGVGNRRPMFVIEEKASEVHPVKPLSPHISIKNDKIELMFFSGAKFTYLLESNAPKSCVFEYNVSKFRGREYVKGYVRDVITNRDAGKHCAEEIAVNNILTLACPKCDCEISEKTHAEIDEIMSSGANYGTLYIATDYATLANYKNIEKFPVELFSLSSGNLADTVLVSPRMDCDLSGFKRIIFLDRQPDGVRYRIDGKNVIMCSDICGYNYIKPLSAQRGDLLKIFSVVLTNMGAIEGSDSGEVAIKSEICASAVQTAFALEVFRQLLLISFEDGKFKLFRGVKTDLSNSELYNTINKIKQKL
ncbi:MAG: single-stranded-DNA-specific exonuclease RecJ [Clostridia bacterium]|nr:single-stranded-DNA-specific exonuclease RecJ [Clostridia bacterium]